MTRYIYNTTEGSGAVKFHVEVAYKDKIYLFSVQKIPGDLHNKEIGVYIGVIPPEKKSQVMPNAERMNYTIIEDRKKPPKEVIDMAITRSVPKTILFPYEK
ncbi:MAG: hypothetical protein ACP5NV_04870 [Candidatus Woesearchaeota archaeon]